MLHDLGVQFERVNIETDAELVRRYGEAIPVLMRGEHELARAPMSPASLRRALQGSSGRQDSA
jgi:hypothetical protein